MFRVGAECTEHPVVLIVTEHQGLTQITHIPYTHETDGRRTLSTAKRCSTRTMRLCLPLLFTPEVWVRHQYSLEDVVDTLNYFKSNQLWKLAVLLGIPLSNSSVKISHSSPTSMVFSSKAIVMVKIVAFLRKHYIFPDKSVLDKTHDDHYHSCLCITSLRPSTTNGKHWHRPNQTRSVYSKRILWKNFSIGMVSKWCRWPLKAITFT